MDKYTNIEGKTITENPLLDEIVYNCQMIIQGIILKDEEEANRYETLESIQLSDQYIACKEFKMKFEDFVYTEIELLEVGIDKNLIPKMIIDNKLIPKEYRSQLLNNACQVFVDNYEELNDYYRKLNGKPPYGSIGILVTEEDIPDNIKNIIPPDTLLSDLSISQIELLRSVGLIDKYKNMYPDAKYLDFIGSNSIDIYSARKARKFEPLYIPNCGITQIQEKFEELLAKNRLLFLHTIYSDAYSIESDYYDKFIIIMIILQSFTDIIIEMPDYYIRKDLFDRRTIKYIFEANGVEYYSEIPLRYQIAMVRNLNRLIKFSSTDQNLIDICSLFGCKNIEIFKYYILRDRKIVPGTNEYIIATKEDEEGNIVEDFDQEYELRFLRVPIKSQYDDNIRNQENIREYDDITLQDQLWDGDDSHEYVKQEILKREFNVLRTKYYGIETIYDITEMTFELGYFMNIFMNGPTDHHQLALRLPFLSTSVKFEVPDVIYFLSALGYIYNGAGDGILWDQQDILYIKGFNFDADMATIAEWVASRDPNYAYTLEELGVAGFKFPEDGIITINQLMDIYTTNKAINQHLVKMMKQADDKIIYDIYKYLYDSLMVVQMNTEYITDMNGNPAKTISDYLFAHSPILYNKLLEIKSIHDTETMQSTIVDLSSNIAEYLDNYLGTDEMDYIIAAIPGVSLDYIKGYMNKVIKFFKSFKITMLPPTTIYKFADPYENTIFMIDEIILHHWFHKTQMIAVIDRIAQQDNDLLAKQKIEIVEKLYRDVYWFLQKPVEDDMIIRDVIESIMEATSYEDTIVIYDGFLDRYSILNSNSRMEYYDRLHALKTAIEDDYWYIVDMFYNYQEVDISDTLFDYILDNIYEKQIVYNKPFHFTINEYYNPISTLEENENISISKETYDISYTHG